MLSAQPALARLGLGDVKAHVLTVPYLLALWSWLSSQVVARGHCCTFYGWGNSSVLTEVLRNAAPICWCSRKYQEHAFSQPVSKRMLRWPCAEAVPGLWSNSGHLPPPHHQLCKVRVCPEHKVPPVQNFSPASLCNLLLWGVHQESQEQSPFLHYPGVILVFTFTHIKLQTFRRNINN